ncbi:undecaprenyl/decaprenyl-phosphate alpha-N-acetylglucosaminyl 1-phosphate transferase [bacterium]|nr:undecaprenyl/decaprenyl-phosphate alpha-N-acetylglucosaminyl 1-phosphate transferase [bacterium]MCG2678269.1 undecaprenyl/decaprenyl-phosphate alpha-N-acetylglucosaminyl 1-phosphate transferase [bacterium]
MLKYYFIAFFSSLILVFLLTPLARRMAFRFDILDHPRAPVKVHKEPVPYLGGVAIFLAFLVPVIAGLFFLNIPEEGREQLLGILLGGTIIIALGLADDLKGLSAKTKLFVETIAAILLIAFGVRLKFLPVLPSIPLTILWVVGITNAFNIIDIMDGLSSGVAFIAALALIAIALPGEQAFVILACVALAGACLGFLRHNLFPAKIYMGDAGSLFLGFTMAAIAIGTSYTAVNRIALFAPILILGIPIYDTFLVTALRTKKGRSILRASNDHFALRLVALGLSRKKTVLIIYLISILLAVTGVLVTLVEIRWAISIYCLVILLSFLIGHRLAQIEMREETHG